MSEPFTLFDHCHFNSIWITSRSSSCSHKHNWIPVRFL